MHILTLKDTAQELTISRSTLYLLIRKGEIKTVNITSKRVGVLKSEIERYLVQINKHLSKDEGYELICD